MEFKTIHIYHLFSTWTSVYITLLPYEATQHTVYFTNVGMGLSQYLDQHVQNIIIPSKKLSFYTQIGLY